MHTRDRCGGSTPLVPTKIWEHRLMDGYRLVTPEVRDRDPLFPLILDCSSVR